MTRLRVISVITHDRNRSAELRPVGWYGAKNEIMTLAQILLLAAAAAAVVGDRAEPTAHLILLATQRTGSTWVMSELSKHGPCIATGRRAW